MDDTIWFIMICVIFLLLGLLFAGLGLAIWKKQKTELIISYHMNKVSDGNRQAFCKLCGIGMLVSGIGFAVSGIWTVFTAELYSWIPMIAGLIAGILLLAVSVARYNR